MRNSTLVLTLLAALSAHAADTPPKPAGPTIVVKLVTDFDSGKLVSDLEKIEEITQTDFDTGGSQEVKLGEKSTLWVRNAHIDGKFFFERYYQDKYIGRSGRLEIEVAQLGAGEHAIEPGAHKFTLDPEGKLSSTDPDVRIDRNTLALRLHKVTVYGVDGAKAGPAEFRLVPAELGVLSTAADLRLDPKSLPDPKVTLDPQHPPKGDKVSPQLTSMLSHQADFFPLTVWLPANQVGQGYVLYPSWQAFHLTPEGKVDLAPAGIPRVPGIEVSGAEIVIPYRRFSGQISSHTKLAAGVGAVRLAKKMNFGATLAPTRFVAAHERPAEDFYLLIDNDFTRHPHKFFVADNTSGDKDAIRMLAVEWAPPIYPRGGQAAVQLRVLEMPGKETLKKPEVRMCYSLYQPSNPAARTWKALDVVSWQNGRESGELRFRVPDIDFSYIVLRVEVFESGDKRSTSPLAGEIAGCVVQPDQQGTASFIANRGRNAFVAGEDIDLELVLRSQRDRQSGQRAIVLKHPDGREESISCADSGAKWQAQALLLPGTRTVNLVPGEYTLAVRDLPNGIASVPFQFELAGRQKPSLYHIVKPSKYTGAMNGLEPSHLSERFEPIDLDRAMRTISDLGYTRVDHMTYTTHHHLRGYTWREELSTGDDRLPPPEAVYTPTPREQMLNACVRNGLQYSDVWLSYGDFHLPRQIEGYTRASERWMAREMQAMRHSPALDGMILYDEMYQSAVVGFVEGHAKMFPAIRARLAEKELGETPAKIEQAFSRYIERPRTQRDPAVLQKYLRYQDWQQHSWAEYVDRMVKVGRELAPQARFGTYLRTWLHPGSNDDLYHGYPPDLFKNLDIVSHIHYADNSTCWVNICMLAQILRTGQGKTLYVNMPIPHEGRTNWDGQYQRHMAFALMSQGANGVSQWGMNQSFLDGPNPGTAVAKETTAHLNHEILRPFGEIIDQTTDGYRKIGIVSTLNQHALGAFKQLATAHQTEGIWTACWRLGYPAVFVREEHMREKLEGFSVLFVPGVRFDQELDELVVKRLKEAIANGIKVVVEADSTLELPGITKLTDWQLNSNFLGTYFPTWSDDELNKVYEKSQLIVDYLRPKLKEWNVEPAASGPFKVGPNWRDGGEIQYLVMANFEDPDYTQTVRQQMAKPVLMPLTVPAHRGRVAYDLLAQKELTLAPAKDEDGRGEVSVSLDMLRVQGALVAFLPEQVARLEAQYSLSSNPCRLRLSSRLIGASGKPIDAVFPVQLKLHDNNDVRAFQRVLGRDLSFELDLPQSATAKKYRIELREAVSGQTLSFEISTAPTSTPTLELANNGQPHIPYPTDVRNFLANAKKVVIVPSRSIPGAAELANDLATRLRKQGVEARISDEAQVYHAPTGDPQEEDPLNDGFHSWHSKQEVIGPAVVVDEPVIVLGGRSSSLLVDLLTLHGYVSVPPIGRPGLPTRPSIQVAKKGLHYAHDTLCLVANDRAGLEHCVSSLLGKIADSPTLPSAKYGPEQKVEAPVSNRFTPAVAYMGTNEMVYDLDFDATGNLYAITWGHGKNLYSFGPDGQPRWSRYLPEMGANRLDLYGDSLFAYTASGARMYRLSLDNRPIAQARLNMDPGDTLGCDNYSLSTGDYAYIPAKQLLLHNMGDRMRTLDDEFNIVAEWRGEEYFDRDVAEKVLRRALHAYALSPDGERIAQLESSSYFTKWAYKDQEVFDTHLVIRDLTGKLLHEYKNVDNGLKIQATLVWPPDAPGPVIYAPNLTYSVGHERWQFGPDLQLASKTAYDPGDYNFGQERRLIRSGRTLAYFDSAEHQQCTLGPLETMPTFAALSPDGTTVALEDEYRNVLIYSTADGRERARIAAPEIGKVLRFTPDSKQLVLGGCRGGIFAWDLNGKLAWQQRLAEYNDALDKPLPLIDPTFKDYTPKLWPVSHDEPGELDKLVRTGANRLVNGDCETEGGWQNAEGSYRNEGYQSSRALAVGPQMVGQEVTGFLGTHVTWVLEFFYRSASPRVTPELLAGIMTQSDHPDSVAGRFRADGAWKFGRVVIKNGSHCQKLLVGFSSQGGEILVDQVQFRQIRFPSVNHLIYDPIHQLKPIVLDNPLFSEKYDPVGNLREQSPGRVIIPTLPGPLNLVESAYLQNGRLNEVTSNWYIQPFNRESPELSISLSLREPRWISMVALYFNQYDPANVTPHFDIYANDPETNTDKLVASIRHNGQLFRLVKFPPIKTSLVKLSLVHSIARLRTITEIELYGPLSGREGTPGFVDAEGHNTYMGDFTRVDKREKHLADDFLPPVVKRGGNEEEVNFFAPLAETLVSEDRFYLARTFGKTTAATLAEPTKELYWGRANGLGFTPYGALYGGLLLRSGNDGKLYCLSPESGGELWSVQLGERLFGCPVAIGEDVFVAGSDGKLYQVDLASGTIMKEAPISGTVFGSLTTDGKHLIFITDDGFLNNYRTEDLEPFWKMPLAPYTDSTPAVDQGTVYVADQQGTALAVDVANGKIRWRAELGGEFTRCPVVGPDKVIYGCIGGTLAVLNRSDGKPVWSERVESRFSYEPLLLGDRVLYFRGSAAVVAQLSDGAESMLQISAAARQNPLSTLTGFTLPHDPVVPISYYKGSLFFIDRPADSGHVQFQVNNPWHVNGGNYTILTPGTAPVANEAPGRKGPGAQRKIEDRKGRQK